MTTETPEQKERRHAQRVRDEMAHFARAAGPEETLAETVQAIYCALDDMDEVPERLHPADIVSKHLQRGNMSGDGCDVVPRRPPRETPEDRTRLPLELEALVGERVDTWQAALVDHVSEGEIVASVWAFIDRIRQKAAVAERERVARIIESGSTGLAVGGADGFWYMPGPKSRMVLAGSDLSLAVAAWLRSGGKEPGQ